MVKQEHVQSLTNRVSILEKQVERHVTQDNLEIRTIPCTLFNGDIIGNGKIAVTSCENDKIVSTNNLKQLTSINLCDWVYGTDQQINVIPHANGKVILSCSQNISPTSSPIFTNIKLTGTPSESNDVITKKYVDDKYSNFQTSNELLQAKQIKITNTTGECLSLGTSSDTHVNLNTDTDGALHLSTTKENITSDEVDIYSKTTNFLSNLETSSPTTGSVVIYGGVGIAKDLSVGGGIYLGTTKSIPTKLDVFEEGTMIVNWYGLWDHIIETNMAYQRIGRFVSLMIPSTVQLASSQEPGIILNTIETYLPERLRPMYDVFPHVDGLDNDTLIELDVTIYGDTGKVQIRPRFSEKFTCTSPGVSGFKTFCVSYMVQPLDDIVE